MKINEIDIKISKAVITDITIRLEGDTPKYEVSGWLVTDRDVNISRFYYYSSHWLEASTLDVPIELHKAAAEIFKLFTPVVYKKINGLHPTLETGGKK